MINLIITHMFRHKQMIKMYMFAYVIDTFFKNLGSNYFKKDYLNDKSYKKVFLLAILL